MKEGRLGGEWEELEGMMRELELEREMKSREKKRNIITRVEKEMKEREKAGWWDEECRELKIKVREKLGRWKKQGGKERRIRREYRKVNVEKRRKERVRWERKIEGENGGAGVEGGG